MKTGAEKNRLCVGGEKTCEFQKAGMPMRMLDENSWRVVKVSESFQFGTKVEDSRQNKGWKDRPTFTKILTFAMSCGQKLRD